ncbi:hypothetical protein PMAYCL1PPCAC_28698, partial [Pristionchus mayeri]
NKENMARVNDNRRREENGKTTKKRVSLTYSKIRQNLCKAAPKNDTRAPNPNTSSTDIKTEVYERGEKETVKQWE